MRDVGRRMVAGHAIKVVTGEMAVKIQTFVKFMFQPVKESFYGPIRSVETPDEMEREKGK